MKDIAFARREIFVALASTAALLALSEFAQPRSFVPARSSYSKINRFTQDRQSAIQVRSSLVQVDVTVTDKNGKHIARLTRENFQLSEDNQSQKLAAVDYYDVGINSTDEGFGPIFIELEGLRNSEALRAICRDHRMIMLFFDRTSMDPEDMLRAVDESKKFIREEMAPADLVAIAEFGKQLRVITSFTNDRAMLESGLEFLSPDKKGAVPGAPVDEPVDRTLLLATTEERLDAIAALARMLEEMPGRKAVIHFTGGLGSPGRANDPAVVGATGAANKSNVSFYEMNSQGLCERPPGGDARVGMRGGPTGPPLPHVSNMHCAPVATLYTLAADTGGALFSDSNDFAPFFKQVEDDSTGYYLLAYEPSNRELDGTYRKISVKLVGVPGGRVTFRAGYFAPKEEKQKH
jgi:VWFA-related protein